MADINYTFFLSLTIIAIGFIVKKLKIITEEGGKSIAKLILNITLPAMIFNIVSTLEIDPNFLLLPFICVLFSPIVVAVSFLLFRKNPREAKGLLLMTSIGFNMGLFAFPLIEGIWGTKGLQLIAMLDIGNAFIIFVLSYTIGAIFSPNQDNEKKVNFKQIVKSLMKSIPLLSYIIALAINFSGLKFPLFFSDLLDIISRANMALTLLLLGIYLNFKFEKSQWNLVLKVLIIRYSLGIGIGILFFVLLPFPELYRAIILIGLILPLSMALVPFSVEFGYNDKIVGTITNLSIVISFTLMWIIVTFLGID
jgi:hypothetical protein